MGTGAELAEAAPESSTVRQQGVAAGEPASVDITATDESASAELAEAAPESQAEPAPTAEKAVDGEAPSLEKVDS